MKVKIFSDGGEYIEDMDYEEFVLLNKEYSCNTEQYIVKDIKKLIKNLKKRKVKYQVIINKCFELYNKYNWERIMYEDRFQFFIDKCYDEE